MPDVFSKKKRSQIMAAIKSKGNKNTELKLVSIFRAGGITGWRRNELSGKPDFVFYPERVLVFVDGCFWHGCKRHCRMPTDNRPYWADKIAKNVARDRETTRHLKKQAGMWSESGNIRSMGRFELRSASNYC
jgi:DNA mismatch endonuclease, patch repair protein